MPAVNVALCAALVGGQSRRVSSNTRLYVCPSNYWTVYVRGFAIAHGRLENRDYFRYRVPPRATPAVVARLNALLEFLASGPPPGDFRSLGYGRVGYRPRAQFRMRVAPNEWTRLRRGALQRPMYTLPAFDGSGS